MANKRAPKELTKYVVVVKEKLINGGLREGFRYFHTQKEAKEWAKTRPGKIQLFRINYDFYADLSAPKRKVRR